MTQQAKTPCVLIVNTLALRVNSAPIMTVETR